MLQHAVVNLSHTADIFSFLSQEVMIGDNRVYNLDS